VEDRLSVTVSGFDRLLSGNATNYRRKKHSLRPIKRPLSRLPVSPIIIERLRLLSVPKIRPLRPDWDSRGQETVNLLQNTSRAHSPMR
jgi:hypothetical protein